VAHWTLDALADAAQAARRFFEQVLDTTKVTPSEVTTDQAPVYAAVQVRLADAGMRGCARCVASSRTEAPRWSFQDYQHFSRSGQ
jgi:transposase-like protein